MKWQQIPCPLPQMRIWGAVKQEHSFTILLEERMGGEFEGWTGYSLSWKRMPNGKVNKIPVWYQSLEEATKACEDLAKQVLGD